MWLVPFALIAIVLFGHLALWVMAFNRLHAISIRHATIRRLEKGIFVAVPALPIYLVISFLLHDMSIDRLVVRASSNSVLLCYASACYLMAAYIAARWIWDKSRSGNPPQLASNHTEIVDVAKEIGFQPIGSWSTRLLSLVPGNQIFQLTVNVKTLEVPGLDPRLDGLTITHLSDLHFTGNIGREFFDFVIDRANELDSDLVAVTGDIIDGPQCMDWIPETVGRLTSRFGAYYVLGNHDKRHVDADEVRGLLEQNGFIDLGGKWLPTQIHGVDVLLAGNEVPWFGSISELDESEPCDNQEALRILLSHSPDQITWARRHNFDLMLAGHTHGGQIRLPVIGPMVAPSNFGVKYASGTFYEAPTLMHVSRGISGQETIRLNCMPELTQVLLRAS